MTEEQTNFLKLVSGPALESEANFEIPACVTIAQAILESGWGKSQLFIRYKNPFGIKYAHSQGRNPLPYADSAGGQVGNSADGKVTLPTTEYAGGILQHEGQAFAIFGSLEQAFNRHAILLSLNRYRPALVVRDSWRSFAKMVQVCGYSTDPNYADKLAELVEVFHLADSAMLRQWAGSSWQLGTSADGQIGSGQIGGGEIARS